MSIIIAVAAAMLALALAGFGLLPWLSAPAESGFVGTWRCETIGTNSNVANLAIGITKVLGCDVNAEIVETITLCEDHSVQYERHQAASLAGYESNLFERRGSGTWSYEDGKAVCKVEVPSSMFGLRKGESHTFEFTLDGPGRMKDGESVYEKAV